MEVRPEMMSELELEEASPPMAERRPPRRLEPVEEEDLEVVAASAASVRVEAAEVAVEALVALVVFFVVVVDFVVFFVDFLVVFLAGARVSVTEAVASIAGKDIRQQKRAADKITFLIFNMYV